MYKWLNENLFFLAEPPVRGPSDEVTTSLIGTDTFADTDYPSRLIGRHFPSPIPTKRNETPFQRCHACATTSRHKKIKKLTKYMCLECNVSLCTPCFGSYHTILHY